MASILQIENLTKSYGDRLLFADVTFGMEEGDKIGVVARNGTGKSTLLRIICGRESPDSGNVTWRQGVKVGFLEQAPDFGTAATIKEAAMLGCDRSPETELECERLLSQMKLDDVSASPQHLSGGQRKRVALVGTLLQHPDMIVLDEPTNHLDIEVIEWLEEYLKRARCTLLMVTHDRYFLDRVCSRILELDDATAYLYDGNYDYFLRRREERIEAQEADAARARNLLRKEQDWMNRQPQARAGKARYRIEQYYNLKERSRGRAAERDVTLDTRSSRIGSKIFEAEHISKRYGDKIILHDFSYCFARGEKVGIVGANGVGKSTFIKMLQGLVDADEGRWDVGETVRFGYYSQDGIEFDSSKKVIDAITEIAEEIDNGAGNFAPMQWLQRFLFSPADQQKYIATLSGGERCRLHLATVLMRRPNFLILDEPTNDLDIMTLGILEQYLADFEGCVIVISHDRFFLDNIVDHIFVMQGEGRIKDFPGNYTDYRNHLREQARATDGDAPGKPKGEKQRTERKQKLSFKERKEFEALEKEIEELTAEKESLAALFSSGEAVDDIAAASARFAAIQDELDTKEMRWLELSEKA
ncbi:MAG: ABC-F family ATP-binding cassette domain-containing protein [Muribaculaceae bacterium]|nr:ABC-F family ATP-binding cassette domain-containing protein [Muribaculaceae bacterium]